jgi:hypothetical protein
MLVIVVTASRAIPERMKQAVIALGIAHSGARLGHCPLAEVLRSVLPGASDDLRAEILKPSTKVGADLSRGGLAGQRSVPLRCITRSGIAGGVRTELITKYCHAGSKYSFSSIS